MAHLHHSEIIPSKLEVAAAWLRARPWFVGGAAAHDEPGGRDAAADIEKIAAFRFDDPDGRVGIETMFLSVGGGPVLQVPLTYRDAPLDGGEPWLLGTMEHSVLGTRFVYDALGDPAYLRALATAALQGGSQADEFFEEHGAKVYRDPSATAMGSGSSDAAQVAEPAIDAVTTTDVGGVSVATTGILRVAVARLPGDGVSAEALAEAAGVGVAAHAGESAVVTGSWAGHDSPVTLAVVVRAL